MNNVKMFTICVIEDNYIYYIEYSGTAYRINLQKSNYKIVEKDSFTVIGASKVFKYDTKMYTDIDDYPNRNRDENYYSEIWIPVKKK